jgi:hypothetical protein
MKGIVKKFKEIFNCSNKKEPNYDNWAIQMRIERIKNDANFINHCQHLSVDHPKLEEEMEFWNKLARLKIDNPIDYHNYDKKNCDYEQLKKEVFKFYLWLDQVYQKDYSFINNALDNLPYFTCTARKQNERSNTSGANDKRIFVNLNEGANYVGTKRTAVHEFGHSFEQSFEGRRYVDKQMMEVCACIIDNLYFDFASKKHPGEADAIKCDYAKYLVSNIDKAKKSLFEACVVQVVTGKATEDELKDKYGDLFSLDYIRRRLKDIETYQFGDLYEGRYLLPQAIAKGFMDLYHKEPEQAIRNLKGVMKNNTELSVDDAILKLGLNKKEYLMQDYIDTFIDRYERVRAIKTTTDTETLEK